VRSVIAFSQVEGERPMAGRSGVTRLSSGALAWMNMAEEILK
jgi:hypothetical protein